MFRVIETFSGIGSQAKALTRIGKPFEIVNTADWDINAILAYCLIHKGKIDINKYAEDVRKRSDKDLLMRKPTQIKTAKEKAFAMAVMQILNQECI